MRQRAWLPVMLGALAVGVLVLLAWVSAAGDVDLWHEGAPRAAEAPPPPPPTTVAPTPTTPPVEEPTGDEIPGVVMWIVFGFLAAMTLLVLLLLIRWLATRSWRLPRRTRALPALGDVEPLPDIAAAVQGAGADLHAALRTGTPRNAIVACWVRLEAAVAGTGMVPRPSETSLELTTRVLSERAVHADAIRELGELYREARFSEHELGEAERERAIDALDELHRELAAEASAPAGVPAEVEA